MPKEALVIVHPTDAYRYRFASDQPSSGELKMGKRLDRLLDTRYANAIQAHRNEASRTLVLGSDIPTHPMLTDSVERLIDFRRRILLIQPEGSMAAQFLEAKWLLMHFTNVSRVRIGGLRREMAVEAFYRLCHGNAIEWMTRRDYLTSGLSKHWSESKLNHVLDERMDAYVDENLCAT